MNFLFFFFSMTLILIIIILFFLASKMEKWDVLNSSSFECGFSSYFFSRFSFSIHYFMVALIFLFLDLELCFLMPFLKEFFSTMLNVLSACFVVFILLMGLILEWKDGKLDWII